MALVKHNNNSISSITTPGSLAQGKMTLISSQTASSSTSIEFTSGIDSTYPIYRFEFINIHPSSTNVNGESFKFNLSTDGGSNYNVTKTSTYFYAVHTEADVTAFSYYVGGDLAQGTGDQLLSAELGGGNDESLSGEMYLFNPSSSSYVKHFMATVSESRASAGESNNYIAGYGNTTSPINAVKFSMIRAGENIQSGTFKLYGIKGD